MMNHNSRHIATQLLRRIGLPRPHCGYVYPRFISSLEKKEWSTPLAKTIAEAIKTTGPISIASYMRQVLTNPEAGYYTTASSSGGSEVFGRKGDFVTSPEITQVFGELIGIWTVAEWIAQGRRSSGVELIEVGPGKGTLMDDILRTIRRFKEFAQSIETIYLVETSATLRNIQKERLCGSDATLEETEIGYKGVSKHIGTPIVWVEDMRLLPYNDKMPFIFAHEFFDALPIHAFESVAQAPDAQQSPSQIMTPTGPATVKQDAKLQSSSQPQWRELLVNLNPKSQTSKDEPEFQLSRAKIATPTSVVLPEISERYKALKSKPGSIIEISPESRIYAADFARRIGGFTPTQKPPSRRPGEVPKAGDRQLTQNPKLQPSGAALIIDYGTTSTVPVNSLRGIRQHRKVSPFAYPGQVDVSADVDFTALAEAALDASEGVEVHGPVDQADFLRMMGIAERAAQLEKHAKDEETRKRIESGWRRLVDRGPNGMGKVYKALAIVPENGGRRRPVGFGGSI